MSGNQDTEITLGMGRILGLFFGLVALCAVFFGLGFRLGRGETATVSGDTLPMTQTSGGARPSATKTPAITAPAAKPAKPPDQPASDNSSPTPTPNPTPPESPTSAASASYFVQVAAVSKQEDAEALVDALKRKQYAAMATAGPTDKLFHVQVGPFTDIKDAEAMRSRLTGDGYNPILKK